MKNYIFLFCLLTLSACSGTGSVQARRTNAAAGIPRYIDHDPYAFQQIEKVKIGLSTGVNHGVSWDDSGIPSGSTNLFVGPTLRVKNFSAGWIPFLTGSHINVDDNLNAGSLFHLGWRFNSNNKWHFSTQTTYANSRNESTDEGCDEAYFTSWINYQCMSKPYYGRSTVSINEIGLHLILQKELQSRDSVSVITSIYRTALKTSNTLERDPGNDHGFSEKLMNFAIQTAYNVRFSNHLLFSIGAGASFTREVNTNGSKKYNPVPVIDARFQL